MKMWIALLFFAFQGQPDRVIGLLRLPQVLGTETCAPYKPETILVFARTSEDSPRIGTIEVTTPMQAQADGGCMSPTVGVKRTNGQSGELPTEEVGYEIPAAVVYERSGMWFRIRLDQGSGWIRMADTESFTAYADLVIGQERLPFLEEVWDGELYNMPGPSGRPVPLPDAWRSLVGKSIPYVSVLESQTVGGELWFRIRLSSENACVEPGRVLPRLEGWLPAYAREKRVVWFFSRGC
jgi:hypothetical protein